MSPQSSLPSHTNASNRQRSLWQTKSLTRQATDLETEDDDDDRRADEERAAATGGGGMSEADATEKKKNESILLTQNSTTNAICYRKRF
jgi:hypothetical protein